jgi:cytoskeletal protein RodZ
MRDDARREFEKRIRGLPNRRIEAEMEEWAYDSEERSILRRELEERRRAKDAPKERRHQDLKRLHWFAAVVSLIGAAASWAAVWFQWHRSPPPAAPANPLAAISPVPTPQESSAVTSPAATPEELVPPLEEASATTRRAASANTRKSRDRLPAPLIGRCVQGRTARSFAARRKQEVGASRHLWHPRVLPRS